jgi:hypothetical protein
VLPNLLCSRTRVALKAVHDLTVVATRAVKPALMALRTRLMSGPTEALAPGIPGLASLTTATHMLRCHSQAASPASPMHPGHLTCHLSVPYMAVRLRSCAHRRAREGLIVAIMSDPPLIPTIRIT